MAYPIVTDAIITGKAGELLAMCVVEQLGYQTSHNPSQGFDACLFLPDGMPVRMEVKTTRGSAEGAGVRWKFITSTGSKSKTPIDEKNCDIVCLVALDIRRCYFVAAKDIIKTHTTVYLEKFIDGEAESLEKALGAIKR